jgi:hypothetical protein
MSSIDERIENCKKKHLQYLHDNIDIYLLEQSKKYEEKARSIINRFGDPTRVNLEGISIRTDYMELDNDEIKIFKDLHDIEVVSQTYIGDPTGGDDGYWSIKLGYKPETQIKMKEKEKEKLSMDILKMRMMLNK